MKFVLTNHDPFRTIALRTLAASLALASDAVPAGAAPSKASLCAAALAAARETSAVPEAVIASAWTELLTPERNLSGAELEWLRSLATDRSASVFNPSEFLFDSAIHGGLAEISILIETLRECGIVDREHLLAAIREHALRITESEERRRSTQDEAQSSRSPTHAQARILRGHEYPLIVATFSPDGRRSVTASFDRTTKVWGSATGLELLKLSGHGNSVRSARFSPDGKTVVTASSDETARIWEVETGKALLTLTGHTGWVNSAAFGPDGQTILTASYDRTARIWDWNSF